MSDKHLELPVLIDHAIFTKDRGPVVEVWTHADELPPSTAANLVATSMINTRIIREWAVPVLNDHRRAIWNKVCRDRMELLEGLEKELHRLIEVNWIDPDRSLRALNLVTQMKNLSSPQIHMQKP